MIVTHPPAADLEAFALGRLTGDSAAAVETHLSDCSACAATAAGASDPFTDLLRSAVRSADTPPTFAGTLAWGATAPADPTGLPDLDGHPRYRLLRPLGAGGMGTVYLAEHTVMGRPVALKVIRPEFLAKPGAADRFRREVRAAAKLAHPNIVAAFDAEQAGATHFLVMEYVEGETLADRLAAGPLPVTDACRAARDAARGLAHAHSHGLTHRDVKPHNLMAAADGSVKVLDFGLVTVATDPVGSGLTAENVVVGTPDYIAPEQAEDARSADPRSDVYSLGCTLYHLLAGRVPFPADTVLKKLDARRTRDPELLTGIPADLTAVVAKMMAKRPDDRYQTADDVVAALDPFCDAAFSRDAPAERARPPRRWAIALGLLAAAVVLIAGVVIIRDKDGKIVGWFRIPAGGKAEVVPDPPVPPAAASDRERILGTWKPVRAEAFGEPVQQQLIDLLRPALLFTPNKLTLTFDLDKMPIPVDRLNKLLKGFEDQDKALLPKELAAVLETRRVEAVYLLDPTKTPKTININYLSPVKKTLLGIYSLDGDALTICVAVDPERAEQRPTELVAGAGQVCGTLARVPEAESPGQVRKFGRFRGAVYRLVLSADGRRVFAADAAGVSGWDWQTGAEVWATDRPGGAMALAGARDLLAVGGNDGFVRVLGAGDGAERAGFRAHPARVTAVAVAPDGTRVAAAGGATAFGVKSAVRVWDAATGRDRVELRGHAGEVWGIDWSPDGTAVATAGNDGTVRLWDPTTGAETHSFRGHRGRACWAAFGPGGKTVASGGEDMTVRLWDVGRKVPLATLDGHDAWVGEVAFTPDGGRLVSVGGMDRRGDGVRVWDVATGKPLHHFADPRGAVHTVVVTRDGRHAITGDEDGAIRVFRLPARSP